MLAGWLLLALLVVGWPAVELWAQPPAMGEVPAPPSNNPDEKLPSSIREAYERAEEFGEEPDTEKDEPEQRGERSPWFDGVHYVGVGGGLFLLAGLATGLWIYLVVAFRTGPRRVLIRRLWRRWHYALGFVAGGLALAHAVGRFIQEGEVELGLGPPVLTAAALILLLVSGVIRAWPPLPLARHPQWWAWSHRALAALTVLALFWHGISMYAQFVRGS